MTKQINVPFAKFQAVGNDFLIVGGEGLPRSLPKFARAILDRHRGIGADGLLVLTPPGDAKHHARARVFNADGSEAEMSGNGIRCAGAFLADLSPAKQTFLIETAAGLKSLEKAKGEKGKWLFRVAMGAPVLDPGKIPFAAKGLAAPIVRYLLRTRYGALPVTVTSMGNPHCSVFVKDFAAPGFSPAPRLRRPPEAARSAALKSLCESSALSPLGERVARGGAFMTRRGTGAGVPAWIVTSSCEVFTQNLKGGATLPAELESLGREIETNPLFPNRTNVEFVRVISRREIAVLFWERGVGHTLSSGTGSCAASVASILNGFTDRQVRVQTQAGSLRVAWPTNGEIILTGPVERVGRGTYTYA